MTDRIRLSRVKGWRLPDDAVKVDRATKWGNPFVVGVDGSAAECVDLYRKLLAGLVCVSAKAPIDRQHRTRSVVLTDWHELAGKRLACWCRPDAPCHADALAEHVRWRQSQ